MASDWYAEHLIAVGVRQPPVNRSRMWRRWWLSRITDELTTLASTQGFVLSTAQLRTVGVTRSAARHAMAIGRWWGPRPGFVGVVDVRLDADSPYEIARRRHALATAAGCLARPGSSASGRSALVLSGLPAHRTPRRPELTYASAAGRSIRNSSHVFTAGVPDGATTHWFGIPTMTAARAIVDAARHNRRDGLVAADAALREEVVTRRGLWTVLETARQWPGVIQAREIVTLASPRAESPLESLVRLEMHDDGFPEPALQFEVEGRFADLALPDYGLLIEADGRMKYTGEERWEEKLREQAMRRPGWWVERVIAAELGRGWPATSRRLRSAMRPGFRPHPL